MKHLGLIEAAGLFGRLAVEMPMAEHLGLEKACVIIETTAKDYIGSEHSWWPPLAESTLANKAGNTPLLETGEMRDSIEHKVEMPNGYIGSDNMKAVWQELGTSRGIPPRSFLGHAASAKGEEVAHVIGRTVAGFVATGEIAWEASGARAGLLRTLGQSTSMTQAPKVISTF
jgi:hypothetical protein